MGIAVSSRHAVEGRFNARGAAVAEAIRQEVALMVIVHSAQCEYLTNYGDLKAAPALN